MRDAGNQFSKPIKPSPNPATVTNEPTDSGAGVEHGEGSYISAPDEARELERAEEAGRKPAIKTERPSNAK